MRGVSIAFMLLALAALAVNGAGIPRRIPGVWAKVREAVREARTWDGSGFRISSDHLNDMRRMVRRGVAPGAELALVPETKGRLDSVERSTHLAAAFERLPGRVDLVGPFGMLAYDALLLPWGSGRVHGADLRAAGFEKTDETLAWELWSRVAPPPATTVADRKQASPPRELCGLALVAAVALCGAWAGGWTGALLCLAGWILALGGLLAAGCVGAVASLGAAAIVAAAMAHKLPLSAPVEAGASRQDAGMSAAAVAAAVAWTILAGLATLSHTFSPPNGLGTSGGRAALWFLSGGVPAGFFSDPALATFQPSYPPGLALMALGAFGVAGGVGEWLSQLLALAPFCALLWLLLSRAPGFAAKFWVFALFCTGTALNMASLYYSEGWMLLFLCVGLSRLPRASRDGDGTGGIFLSWTLIGFAGFFKNEGILFAGLLWAVVRCFRGRRAAPLPALLAGLVPALAWTALSRACGGSLADYAPVWSPDGGRFLFALGRILRDAFLSPWTTTFAWPLATAFAVASGVRRVAGSKPASPAFDSSAREAAALLLLCVPAFAFVYSLSRAPDLDWHVWSSLPRLLWDAAVLAAALRVGFLPIRHAHAAPRTVR